MTPRPKRRPKARKPHPRSVHVLAALPHEPDQWATRRDLLATAAENGHDLTLGELDGALLSLRREGSLIRSRHTETERFRRTPTGSARLERSALCPAP